LESGSLSDNDFPAFAKNVVPFLHVTTRLEDKPYEKLFGELGGTGFPTLMWLDADGRKIQVHNGPRSVKGFEESLGEVELFLDQIEKAENGDAKAATAVLIRQLQLQWFEYDDALARREALTKVSSKEKKELDQLLIDTEVRTHVKTAGKDPEAQRAAGAHFFAMWSEKRLPAGKSELYRFWTLMADHAEHAGDKKLFRRIVGAFDQSLGSDSRYRAVLDELEGRLAHFGRE